MSDGGCYSSFRNSNDEQTEPPRTPSPEPDAGRRSAYPEENPTRPDIHASTETSTTRTDETSPGISSPPVLDITTSRNVVELQLDMLLKTKELFAKDHDYFDQTGSEYRVNSGYIQDFNEFIL
eukprot:397035_1